MSQDPDVTGPEPSDVIVTKSGDPYKTRQAANLSIGAKKLNPAEWEAVEIDEKQFVIARKAKVDGAVAPAPVAAPAAPVAVTEEKPAAPVVEKEKYWVLKFNDRASKNETEDVPLSVNGETIVLHRGKEVIVPGRFRECADHTRQPLWEHWNDSLLNEENSGRKRTGTKTTYPYTVIRETTEEEFRAMKAVGDKELAPLKEQQG